MDEDKQSVSVAIKVLKELLDLSLVQLDALRVKREEIDSATQNLLVQTLGAKTRSSTSLSKLNSSIANAKMQWKLDVLHKKAEMADNLILKHSLTYQLTVLRLQRVSLLPPTDTILRVDGSDMLLELSENEDLQLLSEKNRQLAEEIERIENANTPKKVAVSESNEDLRIANHLMEESKRMDEKSTKGYSEIEKIIRNPSSKVGYNINKYINNTLEDVPNLPPLWDFIYAIRDQLLSQLPDFTEEQIESSLENYIMPLLYNKHIEDLNLKRRDNFVLDQCKKYGNTTQDQFSINPDFKDMSLVPYVKAIAELRSIYFQFSPTKKMSSILRAASAVYEKTAELQPKITMGGDDFIDIWVYVVLQAQIRNLPSTVQYISEYASDDLMTSEMGYYFTSVEVALNFIEKLNDENLKSSPSAQITSRPFIITEKERYRRFCSVDKNIDMVKENIDLIGYKLYAIEDWISKPGRFYCTYLQQTKDPNDKVSVCVLKSNNQISPSQQTFIHDTFFRDKPEEFLQVEDSHLGTLLCSPNPPPDSLGPHILLESGDYDKEIEIIKMVVNLKIMKIPETVNQHPYINEEQRILLIQQFNLNEQLEPPIMINGLIRHVQIALKHLNIFPYLCVIDGIFSAVLTKSIQIFQKQYNDSTDLRYDGQNNLTALTMNFRGSSIVERPARIPSNGILTPDTWICIKLRVQELQESLSDLGYIGKIDPIVNHEEFTNIIKDFQNGSGIMPSGLLCERTVRSLVTKWKEHQIIQNNKLA